MADQQASPSGPDLAHGVSSNEFTGETLLGHVGDQEVLLVRSADQGMPPVLKSCPPSVKPS